VKIQILAASPCRESLPLINARRQSFSLFNPAERLKSFAQAPLLLLFLAFISFGISVCILAVCVGVWLCLFV